MKLFQEHLQESGVNRLWFFEHNKTETEKLIEELYTEPIVEQEQNLISNNETEISANINEEQENINTRIEVLNGSGDSTLLTKATEKLKSQGYNVYKTGTTNSTSKTTIVNKNNVDPGIMSNIKKVLNNGIISNSSLTSSNVDITIVLGQDYNG